MSGLSLDPAGNHFVLRNEKPDGTTATMSLSPDEVVTLAAMVPTMIQTAMAMIRPLQSRSSATAIAAMDVFDFQLRPEMLQTRLLLLLRLGISGSSNAAYALSADQAERLSQRIPPLVAKLREKPPTTQ